MSELSEMALEGVLLRRLGPEREWRSKKGARRLQLKGRVHEVEVEYEHSGFSVGMETR